MLRLKNGWNIQLRLQTGKLTDIWIVFKISERFHKIQFDKVNIISRETIKKVLPIGTFSAQLVLASSFCILLFEDNQLYPFTQNQC